MLLLLAILAAIFWLPAPWSYLAVGAAAVYELAELGVFIWYSPVGQIRVDGELWRARCEEGADPGETVEVEQLGPDLTLIVRRRST